MQLAHRNNFSTSRSNQETSEKQMIPLFLAFAIIYLKEIEEQLFRNVGLIKNCTVIHLVLYVYTEIEQYRKRQVGNRMKYIRYKIYFLAYSFRALYDIYRSG